MVYLDYPGLLNVRPFTLNELVNKDGYMNYPETLNLRPFTLFEHVNKYGYPDYHACVHSLYHQIDYYLHYPR